MYGVLVSNKKLCTLILINEKDCIIFACHEMENAVLMQTEKRFYGTTGRYTLASRFVHQCPFLALLCFVFSSSIILSHYFDILVNSMTI